MLGIIDRVVCRLEWAAERVVMITFGTMVLAVLVSVFTRNISIPVTWLEELSRYMQIWFVSIGFALALRKGLLAGSEVVLKMLPAQVSKWVITLCKIFMLVISVLLLVTGFQLIMHLLNTGQESPNMRIPIVYVYLGIYSGFVLAVVFLISSLLFNLQGRKDQLDKTFLAAGELEEPPSPASSR
jgi:TRAP-type C4-dicarboxylate transport system permease small subunit